MDRETFIVGEGRMDWIWTYLDDFSTLKAVVLYVIESFLLKQTKNEIVQKNNLVFTHK